MSKTYINEDVENIFIKYETHTLSERCLKVAKEVEVDKNQHNIICFKARRFWIKRSNLIKSRHRDQEIYNNWQKEVFWPDLNKNCTGRPK